MSEIAIRVENLSKRYRIGKTIRSSNRGSRALKFLATTFRQLNNKSNEKNENDYIWALRDIDFEVKQGEVLGIIGRNGAGKSTLLKILARITEPTSGRAILQGRLGSLLEVGTGFNQELTGKENIYLSGAILGMRKAEIDRKFDEIIAFSEIERFLETPVKRYSSGMYVRLAFAVAAHLETDILLVDEVLAVGDAAFQKKCLGKMDDIAHHGRTILFVSHNMAAIKQMCNRTIVFHQGQLVYDGSNQQATENYLVISGIESNVTFETLLFHNPQLNPDAKFEVIKVEVLGHDRQRKDTLSTGDHVYFLITWRSEEAVNNGGVELGIHTTDNIPLIQYSTRPLTTIDVKFKPGFNSIYCEFPNFPLAAGRYLLSIGLTRPKIEWLYRNDQFATLTVNECDIYDSGTPLTSDRSYLATQHQWYTT
jgi:lipopolysaccharide transport system ATP-binding protein